MDNAMPLRIWADKDHKEQSEVWWNINLEKPDYAVNQFAIAEYLRADAILPLILKLCEANNEWADHPGQKSAKEFGKTAGEIATRLSEILREIEQ